tara:strand:+ start:1860 stop:3101 length:1242 start_codon:yes stop_codon:yes gene_type:complete
MALEVEEIVSEKNIKAWIVEDNSVPIISMSVTFKGGAYFDPLGKDGTATFVAALLDEGAGNFSSKKFKDEMNELGMKLNFRSSKDEFSISFQTISENKKKSFKLLRSALIEPRFDSEEIEKIRNQIISSIKIKESNIQSFSTQQFEKSFYLDHKFSRNVEGSLKSIKNIEKIDLEEYKKKNFTKSNLIIGISGDVSKSEMKEQLDLTFGDLPEGDQKNFYIKEIKRLRTGEMKIKKKSPQTSVIFGHSGLDRNDKKYFAARIANYVLGGGGFQSKLYKKIREENGLVYSIYSYLLPNAGGGIILGGFQTKNENVDTTLNLLKKEWSKIREKGITQEELDNAKSYFIGSFSRSFSSTKSIATLLNTVQTYKLGIDYFSKRSKIIQDLNLLFVNDVCKNFFKPNELFFTIVGDSF